VLAAALRAAANASALHGFEVLEAKDLNKKRDGATPH